VHPLAFPVHAAVVFGARLFGCTTLIRNLADTFLFIRSASRRSLDIGGAFGVDGDG
jgi:hypothetical protein